MSDEMGRLKSALSERYAIEQELGAGGMATVYLAHDVKHNRKVAVKVLRPELAAILGAKRFLKEIEVTANLQHPHILPLFDSGEADSFLYYVMPYIEGESLREKLNREKQLSIEESIEITEAVASALDYAHRHEVIHRDIKPENILLHEGQPMVADFGIALAVHAAGGQRLTETGLSLGTPEYMSPEQATGDRELDARSDVYSLASVTYEMLVGDPPHTGSTVQAIISKVITEDPRRITLARKTVPAHVEYAVHKALAKLPADRFATAEQFAEALTNPSVAAALAASPTGTAPVTAPALARLAIGHRWLGWAIPLVVAVLAVAAVWGWLREAAPATEQQSVSRLTVALPSTLWGGPGSSVAISPDGRHLAYAVAGAGIYVRAMDELVATPVPNTEGANNLFFSPDGQWLGFIQRGALKKVALAGGPTVTIAEGAGVGVGVSWGPNDSIVFAPDFDSGLWQVSSAGGAPQILTSPDAEAGEGAHVYPDILPGGEAVLFGVAARLPNLDSVAVLSLETGETKVLLEGRIPRYVPTGHLVYSRADRSLQAVPFDPVRLQVTGRPVPVAENMLTTPGGVEDFDFSRTGTLIYAPGSASQSALVTVDRHGAVRPLVEEQRTFGAPRFSPSGDRVAVGTTDGGTFDVWIADAEGGGLSRLTLGGSLNGGPVWTVDGRRVTFRSTRGRHTWWDLFWKPADGSGSAERLLTGSADTLFAQGDALGPSSWSPDGRSLLFLVGKPARGDADIWVMPRDGARTPRPILNTAFDERAPTLSADGRWLAYSSDESGRYEVYVRAFPDMSGKRLVSRGGGTEPVWGRNGRELFYRAGEKMMAVPVQTDPTFTAGTPELLFEGRYLSGRSRHYDIHPDGERFVMIQPPAEGSTHLVVVLNWFEELKGKVGR